MMSIVLAVAFYVLVVFSVGFILSKTEILYSMEHTGLVTADAMAKAFNSVNMAKDCYCWRNVRNSHKLEFVLDRWKPRVVFFVCIKYAALLFWSDK